jgi:hypothetical protein
LLCPPEQGKRFCLLLMQDELVGQFFFLCID